MEFEIGVRTNGEPSIYSTRVRDGRLVKMIIIPTPEEGMQLLEALANHVVPAMKWQKHPLKQWALRKTGKA